MSLLKKITNAAKNVVSNVTQTITHPSVSALESLIVNPLGGQAAVGISGNAATPQQAAVLTAVGAGTIYGGSLLLGPNLGIVPAAGVAASGAVAVAAPASVAGSTVGAAATLPATESYINTGVFDKFLQGITGGQGLSFLSNPGAADSGGTGGTPTTTMGVAGLSGGMKITLLIGGGLLLLWLILSKR